MNYNLPQIPPLILFFVLLWSLYWKGLALWRAANMKQRNWFVVMLIVNTFGILEILYLFWLGKKRMKLENLKFW